MIVKVVKFLAVLYDHSYVLKVFVHNHELWNNPNKIHKVNRGCILVIGEIRVAKQIILRDEIKTQTTLLLNTQRVF